MLFHRRGLLRLSSAVRYTPTLPYSYPYSTLTHTLCPNPFSLSYQYYTLTSTPNHNLPKLLPLPGYPYYHCCYSLTYHTLTPTSTLPVFIYLPYLTSYHYTYSLPNYLLTPTPTILCPSSILQHSALPCPTPPNPTLSNPILTPITYPTLPYHYSLLYPTLTPTPLHYPYLT